MIISNAHRLSFLKDRHRGERVVIVANGPSLNEMDLSFLRREISIGMNKIFLGFRKFGFYPKYYVAVNEKVIRQSSSYIRALNCLKFIGDNGGRAHLDENGLTYFVNTTNPPLRFCKNIAHGMHEGWTVTYAALQIAYFLGFDEVVIIGMDHRYEYQGKPNETRRMDGRDPNHFSPDYFGGGQEWDNPDLARSEQSYLIARETFEQNGRRIIDATVNGSCTIFEKIEYKELFGIY